MTRALLAGLSIAALCFAQEDADLLARARSRIVQMLGRAPKYSCAISITRDYSEPSFSRPPASCEQLRDWKERHTYGLIPYSTDRLRLDVIVAGDRELFAWPGDSSFDDRDLADMVSDGPTGTGSFAGYLSNIFDVKSALIFPAGKFDLNGRTLVRYNYSIPVGASRHRYRAGKEWLLVAYEGTFALDPETADLVHLTFRVVQPPAASRACETSGEIGYSLVNLTGADFLLPSQVRQRFVTRGGYEAENTTRYSACHEFTSESTVSFGDPAAIPPKPGRAAFPRVPAPVGRPVDLELASAIDTTTAAAGDPFAARLVQAIRDTRGNVLVPAGALVHGRLVRVQHDFDSSTATVVFKPESVPTPSGPLPIALVPRTSREYIWATTSSKEKPLPWRAASSGEIPRRNESKLGVYHFRGANVVIPTGFRTQWITAAP